MPRERHRVGAGAERTLSRRTVLAAATTSAAALAGCTDGLTEHEFEATPVTLPEAARSDLALAETVSDASTITRNPDVGGIEGEVTIPSHTAAYTREQAYAHPDDFPALTDSFQPSLLGRYLGQVNGTEGPGSAVVLSGRDLGIDELALPMFEEEPTIPGTDWSLVVPAGARTDGSVSLEETMVLVPGTACRVRVSAGQRVVPPVGVGAGQRVDAGRPPVSAGRADDSRPGVRTAVRVRRFGLQRTPRPTPRRRRGVRDG